MATNLPARFGRVLRKHRTEADWSQEELAHQAGLHRTYISLLERGLRNPSLTVMDSLAAALGTDLESLIRDLRKTR